jgi:Flp pilus assembly protein CpaB
MRASLLAVIAVALIAGLVVVFAVKSLGLLEKPKPAEPPPVVVEKVPPAPPPPPVVRIIAPTRNLFAGDATSGESIGIRQLRPEEVKDYEAHKDEYLPGSLEAALFRIAARDLAGDRPLRKGDLLEAKKPEPLNTRLFPGTRAVTVGITKDRSVSGLIQVGDWVDVYLITEVSRTDNPSGVPHTALLAPHAQVVAKRDTLYPIYDPIRGDIVSYTLASNPYRTALIEHGRNVGLLTLVPVSAEDKKRLDALRDEAIKTPASTSVAATFAPPGSPEFREEQSRLERFANGSLAIGDDDLVRLLSLPVLEPPPPPPKLVKPPKPQPTPPPPAPVTIEIFSGVQRSGTATFPVPYTAPPPVEIPEPPPPVYIPPPPPKYVFKQPHESKPQQPAPKK